MNITTFNPFLSTAHPDEAVNLFKGSHDGFAVRVCHLHHPAHKIGSCTQDHGQVMYLPMAKLLI